MSDAIKHECGIALLRLKKPLEYYVEKYGTAFYGLNKMYLMMEKQRNRGQDGAGLANIKFDVAPGERYISRLRSVSSQPIQDIFSKINSRFQEIIEENPDYIKDVQYLKKNAGFTGELFLGHLRYGTFNKNNLENCQPFLRQNNWMTRNLVLAGNFNLTNVDELFDVLYNLGQYPKEKSDVVTILEKIGHFVDVENEDLFRLYKKQGYNNKEITFKIAENINLQSVLRRASSDWDGGYTMAGLLGHGDAFVMRDPAGIRPAYWYEDDEICVVTSEKPVIQTAFNVKREKIQELAPGSALIIKKSGKVSSIEINPPEKRAACSFERIYFSRGNDYDIYNERKRLGQFLVPQIIKSINNELDNAVFSFIPNTAEMSFFGMMKGLEDYLNKEKHEAIIRLGDNLNENNLREILNRRVRFEKIAVKDAKLRTFITDDDARDDMVAHVYDITYGTVRRNIDHLVVIDDSIVRGTTLKQSILAILDRLEPKKIVVVSSAPQVRYPDCYGIQMNKMDEFIAFEAAIELLKETGKAYIIDDVYKKCKEQTSYHKEQVQNYVKEIYKPFTVDEISNKITQLLTPVEMNAEVEIIYQTIENLHASCPDHLGDWYFTGNYPTPGGNKVVNKAFINYIESRKV